MINKMTLQELTIKRYNMCADEYITRALDFRTVAKEHDQWWKPKIKNHWLFLIKMVQFYINNSNDLLRKIKENKGG